MRNRKRQVMPWLFTACCAQVIRPQSITHPELNSTALGQVALVGSFDSLSTFDYVGENSVLAPVTSNDNLISQSSDSWQYYLSASFADGTISQSCLLESGALIIAGNFTNIRGTDAQGIARLDLNSGAVSTLGNISLTSGINALWCNDSIAYVGGDFQLGESQGLGIWNDTSQSWGLPQFGGFPVGSTVNAIAPITNDTVLFGGNLGAPLYGSSAESNGTQQVGLAAATVSTTDASTPGSNILCMSTDPFEADSGSTSSTLNIDLARTVYLSQIAIGNPNGTDGTQTFRIVSSPSDSIMNLTYTVGGEERHCDAYCPLELGNTTVFSFVNRIGTRNLTISLMSYFGDHAALQGIQLYTTESYVYAKNQLNAALDCQQISSASTSQLQGSWQSDDDFESSTITTGSGLDDTYVRYYPNVSTSGNFSLNLWTPGCLSAGTCSSRGQVNVTTYPGPSDEYEPVSVQLWQTNNEIKYDPIYNGTLVRTVAFNPYVEVRPISGQETPINFVALELQVNFVAAGTDVMIDKLFEYSVSNYTQFSANSTFAPVGDTYLNHLGTGLGRDANLQAIATFNDSIYIGGNFTNGSLIAYGTNDHSLTTVSTDGEVNKLYTYMDELYAIQDYNSVHNISDSYKTIYQDPIDDIALFNLNGSAMLAFSVVGSNSSLSLYNVTSGQWYNGSSSVSGHISQTVVYNSSNFYFGSIRIEESTTGGAASINAATLQVSSLPFELGSQNSSSGQLRKRDDTGSGNSINAGAFYNSANILGGHFTATTSNGDNVHNLIVVNGSTSSGLLTDGLSQSSTINSLAVHENTLVIAGDLSGSYHSIALYDLSKNSFLSQQPSNVNGSIVSIVGRADTIIAFGEFTVDSCSNFCIYNITSNTWTNPSKPSSGTLYGATLWSGDYLIIYGSDLAVAGGTYSLLQYSFNQNSYVPYTGTGIDGNITGVAVGINGDNTKFAAVSWQNGTQGHNIQWFDGRNWVTSTSPLGNSTTISSLSILPVLGNSTNSSIPLGSQNLLAVNGNLDMPTYGNATVASFDGSSWTPLFVASQDSNPGSISSFYSEKQVSLGNPTVNGSGSEPGSPTDNGIRKLMSKGRIVGISFAIAVGCICLLVILGLIWGYCTQRRQAYQRTPQRVDERDIVRAAPPEMIMSL